MTTEWDTLRRIVDHGIEFDYEMIGKDVVMSDFKSFFDGEGFSTKILKDRICIERNGQPVSSIQFKNAGISFTFFSPNRSFQIIMLTTHLMKTKYSSFQKMIREAQEEGITIIPQNTTFD